MGISKVKKIALKALSLPASADLSKTYLLERSLTKVRHMPLFKNFYAIWDREIISDGYKVSVRIFLPVNSLDDLNGKLSLIIYFHGGGWVSGGIDSYTNACANLSRRLGAAVVSVDYRLAPEHCFPAALEDCYAVCREIFNNIPPFGNDDITLMGDSAGGNLAAAVSLLAKKSGEFKPKKQILLYPALYNDYGPSSPFASVNENGYGYVLTAKRIGEYMDFYASSPKDKLSPYFAPLLADDLSDQPETLVITAEFDPLRDEGEEYARRIAADGGKSEVYRMESAIHGFFNKNPAYKEVRQTIAVIKKFLKKGAD